MIRKCTTNKLILAALAGMLGAGCSKHTHAPPGTDLTVFSGPSLQLLPSPCEMELTASVDGAQQREHRLIGEANRVIRELSQLAVPDQRRLLTSYLAQCESWTREPSRPKVVWPPPYAS